MSQNQNRTFGGFEFPGVFLGDEKGFLDAIYRTCEDQYNQGFEIVELAVPPGILYGDVTAIANPVTGRLMPIVHELTYARRYLWKEVSGE